MRTMNREEVLECVYGALNTAHRAKERLDPEKHPRQLNLQRHTIGVLQELWEELSNLKDVSRPDDGVPDVRRGAEDYLEDFNILNQHAEKRAQAAYEEWERWKKYRKRAFKMIQKHCLKQSWEKFDAIP